MKISIIGGGPVASEFIKKIYKSHYSIKYYFPTSKFPEFNNLTKSDCSKMDIEIAHHLEELCDSDLILSAGNHKILDKKFIENNFILNFHGAPLPKYGGSAAPAFALINNDKQFGCTFQKMNFELDSGPILCQIYFNIGNEMTSYDLDKMAIDKGIQNLIPTLDNYFIKNKDLIFIRSSELVIYKRSELEKYAYIKYINLNTRKSLQIIKALTWPGVLKPAYTIINNKKINLTYSNLQKC